MGAEHSHKSGYNSDILYRISVSTYITVCTYTYGTFTEDRFEVGTRRYIPATIPPGDEGYISVGQTLPVYHFSRQGAPEHVSSLQYMPCHA